MYIYSYRYTGNYIHIGIQAIVANGKTLCRSPDGFQPLGFANPEGGRHVYRQNIRLAERCRKTQVYTLNDSMTQCLTQYLEPLQGFLRFMF